jgi:hypothetical protein
MKKFKQIKRTYGGGPWLGKAEIGWEQIVRCDLEDYNAPPAVRRLAVPGGWLYQVESNDIDDGNGTAIVAMWHPPVFVANTDPKIVAGLVKSIQKAIK